MKEKILKKGIKKRIFSVVLALAMVLSVMPNLSMVAHAAADGPTEHCEYWFEGANECEWEDCGSDNRQCMWYCIQHDAMIDRNHRSIEEGSSCELCGYTPEPKPWIELPYQGHTIWYKSPAVVATASGQYGVSCDIHDKEYKFSTTDGSVVKSETCAHITDIDPNQAPPTPEPEPEPETPSEPEEPTPEPVIDETTFKVDIVKNDKTEVHSDIVEDVHVSTEAFNLSPFKTIKGFAFGIDYAVKSEKQKNEVATVKSNKVEVYTGSAFTFGKDCIEVLKTSSVDVVYTFKHKGLLFRVTIPAGTDISVLLDKNGFAGPLWIGKELGTTEIIKE